MEKEKEKEKQEQAQGGAPEPLIIYKSAASFEVPVWMSRMGASVATSTAGEYFRDVVMPNSTKALFAGVRGVAKALGAELPTKQQPQVRRAFNTNWKMKHHLTRHADKLPDVLPGEFTGAETYTYTALPSSRHIRIVRLFPGPPDAAVECTLEAHSIDDPPQYEALSYTWGGVHHTVNCDGKALVIEENLWHALARFRYRTHSRLIWIDAMCIDQGNLSEKNVQLPLMYDVYVKADRVVVWVGEESSNSRMAFETILTCVAGAVYDKLRWSEYAKRNFDVTDFRTMGLPQHDHEAWIALDALLWRPYFTRAWIIQEITVAREALVVCGPHHCLWEDLVIAAKFVAEHSISALTAVDPHLTLKLSQFEKQYREKSFKSTLHVLAQGQDSFATNDRDKIFSMLGLIPADDRQLVTSDYKLKIVEIYLGLARDYLKAYGNLNMLNTIDDHRYRLNRQVGEEVVKDAKQKVSTPLSQALPTWVPDWEVHRVSRSLLLHPNFDSWKAGISTDDAPKPSITVQGSTLRVKGFIVDVLDHAGTTYLESVPTSGSLVTPMADLEFSGKYDGSFKQTMVTKYGNTVLGTIFSQRNFRWETIVTKKKTYPPSPPAFLESRPATERNDTWRPEDSNNDAAEEIETDPMLAFMRALIGDASLEPTKPGRVPAQALRETYEAWKEYINIAKLETGENFSAYARYTLGDHRAMIALRYMDAQTAVSYGRKLFTTKKGYIGLGPSLLKAGAKLVVLRGGRTPFLLLEREKSEIEADRKAGYDTVDAKWTMLGECYVQGLMHGEAMFLRLKEEEFLIA